MTIRDDLKLQVSIRGTNSPFGKIAFSALTEIERLDAIAAQYNELISHMESGGSFVEFANQKISFKTKQS